MSKADGRVSGAHAGLAGVLRTAFTGDPRFVVCVILLGAGAVSVQGLVSQGFRFSKERVDLQRPLSEMDESKLLPYRRIASDRIPKEEVEALGTEEYIRWRIEDTSVGPGDSLRYGTLFITYYSGQPDQVPHVPEECFLGGGYQQLGATNALIQVPGLKERGKDVPARVLTFRKDSAIGGAYAPTVVYLFSVNGQFVGSRNEVRWMLSNPFQRYGYFSKVEVSFGQREGPKDPQIVLKAAERLLGKVLPVLVNDHWVWPPRQASGAANALTKSPAS
jgi:hypothetical protein